MVKRKKQKKKGGLKMEKRYALLQTQILSKLKTEGVSINDSWDKIEKALSETVGKNICLQIAHNLKYDKCKTLTRGKS